MRSSSAGIIAIIVALLALVGLWYWFSTVSPMPSPSDLGGLGTSTGTDGTGTTTGQPSPLMIVSSASGAQVLAAFNGMTLYTYAQDTQGVSNCTATCTATWIPYTTNTSSVGSAPAGASGTVGTIERGDGSRQITYRGMPLYFYVNDTAPGEARGATTSSAWSVATP